MPSANKTLNYDLNQWAGNEYPMRIDFVEDNAKTDAAIKAVDDKAENIDQRVDDLEVEINTPELTAFNASSSIASLPIGALEGKASNLEAEGLTLVNSVENRDFSGGTTGWTAGSGLISEINNILRLTGNGADASPNVAQSKIDIAVGEIWFFYYKTKVNDSNCLNISLQLRESSIVTLKSVSNPIVNNWYELYSIRTIQSDFAGFYHRILFTYPDAATANGKVMEVDGNAGVHAINLSVLGLTSLTEAQLLDLVRSGYIDGIQGVYRPKVEIVGKNKFDIYTPSFKRTSDYISNNVLRATANVSFSVGTTYTFNLKPNTPYFYKYNFVLGGNATGLYAVFANGNNAAVVDSGSSSPKTRQFITDNTGKISITFARAGGANDSLGWVDVSDIQLEEGTVATAYEPHKSSQLTAEVTLHRLPNGVKDRIYEADGEVLLEKNVYDYVFDGGDALTGYGKATNLDGVDVSSVAVSGFLSANNLSSLVGDSIGYNGNLFESVSVGASAGTFLYALREIAGTLYIYAKTSDLSADSLAGFEAYLTSNPLKAIFKIKTPELINLTEQGLVDGELFSFENGTVYNSSDTFHAQNVSFDVPSNRGAQIDSLLESAQTQAKQISSLQNQLDAHISGV